MWHPHVTKKAMVTLGVVVVALALVGWMARPTVVDVETGTVTRGPMRVTVDEEGQTRVRERYAVTAPVSGRVERMALEEGDAVRAGAVAARLAPLPLDAQAVQQARARLDGARALEREAATVLAQARVAAADAKRVSDRRAALLAAGAISEEERERSALALRAREAEVAAAESRRRAAVADVATARAALLALGDAAEGVIVQVRAPVGGTVLRVPERSERVVPAGTLLMEIGDPSRIEVVTDVLSADAVRIRAGSSVEIVDWGGDHPLRGRVRYVEPSAFTRVSALGVDEQRVNVVIDIEGAVPALRDGFRVETRITTWEAPSVLAVPSSAVFERDGKWWAFVVADGRARQREIQVGERTPTAVEVRSGLAAGDVVVLFPSDKVGEGARVKGR